MLMDRRVLLALLVAAAGTAAAAAAQTATSLAHAAEELPPPLSARFAVTRTTAGQPAKAQRSEWFFHRNEEQVALMKGAIDEVWLRDARGRVSFQRVFHEHAKVTDYSSGELATLGIAVDWLALATLVGASERTGLKETARSGRGASLRVRLEGRVGTERLRVDWMPALQLPALVLRSQAGGASTRIELLTHATTAPANWPQPGVRSANYLHLDAADFGDMDYEPVVRLSEALDVRSGWRKPHAHD
jgi:hypothetical protein